VGAAVRIEHFRAVGPGYTVEVFAEPPAATRGRRLTFTVWALGSSDDAVAVGEIDRVIVDRDRFLGSVGACAGESHR
jgi:predicted thioesterase